MDVSQGNGSRERERFARFRRFRDVPLSNLYVSVLDKLGVPLEQGGFGDSTGQLTALSEI